MANQQNWDNLNAAVQRLAQAQAARNKPRLTESHHNIFGDLQGTVGSTLDMPQIPDSPGVVSRLFDIISRTGYATRNLVKDTIDPDPNTDNPFESLWAGFSGIDKTSARDIIDKRDEVTGQHTDDVTKGILGFIGDVALDPLTYVPLGWLGKGVTALDKLASGDKAVSAAVREAGHTVPEATSAASAVAAHTPPPPSQVQGAGAAFVARTNAAHQPPVTNLGMPGVRQTKPSQLAAFGEPSTMPGKTSANAQRLDETLGAPRTQGESLPLFDETGNQTYRTMGPTPGSNLNIYGAGPKAAAPAFDLPKMGDDLANLAATDPRQLRRVGLNGPEVAAHAGEQQQALFGVGDLTSVPPKAAEPSIVGPTLEGPKGRGLFSEREMKEVASIPTNWPEGIKESIKEAAKTPLKDAIKLPRKVDPKYLTGALNKEADKAVVNDVVAAKAAEQPGIVHPVGTDLNASQAAARADAEKSVDAFTSSGTPMDAKTLRDMRAKREAAENGETVDQAYNRIYGKDTQVPAATAPDALTSEAIEQGSKVTGIPLGDSARLMTGKEPVEILQDGRKLSEPTKLSHRDQWSNAAAETTRVNKELVGQGLKGEELQVTKMYAVRDALKAHEAANIAKGIYPEIESGSDVFRMSTTDVWDALGTKATREMQFSPRSIPVSSQLTGAAHTLKMVHEGVPAEQAIKEIAAALSAKPGAHWTGQEIHAAGSRAMRNAEAMWNARDRLYKTMIDNEEAFKTRDTFIAKQAGEEVANDTISKINDVSVGVGDKMNAIADVQRNVTRTARERGASTGSAAIGAKAAEARLAPHVTPQDAANARHTQFNSHAQAKSNTWNTGRAKPGNTTHGGPSTTTRSGQTSQQVRQAGQANANANINTIAAQGTAEGVPLAELVGYTSDNLFRKIYHGLSALFRSGYGMGTLHTVGRGQLNHFDDIARSYADLINKAQKEHGLEDSKVAWEAIRNETGKTGLTPAQKAAYDSLENLSRNVISRSKGVASWGDTPMFRESLDPETVNSVLSRHGVKQNFRAKDNALEVPEQWREWTDVDNPWQFLTNMQHAQMELSARSGIGRYFTKEFKSDVPLPGYVKIKRTQGQSDLSHVIDTDGYYPKYAAEWLGKYSREVDTATNINAGIFKNWLDPLLSMFKTSATVIRPGHHLRNMIGDIITTRMDGVGPQWLKKGFETQKAAGGFKGTYDDLLELSGDVMPQATGHAVTVTLKDGTKEALDHKQLYWLAHRAGLLLDYRPAEDILETGGKRLGAVANAIEKNRYVRFMGNVSTKSSDTTRLAHLIGLMNDSKVTKQYDSVESMVNGLTARVQKYHPDVKGLTKFEQKYMRRIIPFYSWFKQAMPMLAMTTLTHPARVTEIPKAQYNLNVAMGGDPQNTENPFDAHQLYPDFLRNSISGAFGAGDQPGQSGFMMDWGSPVEAAAQMFNGKVGANLADMLNPVIKQPWGLISGSHPLDSSHYIPDKGEWIDSGLPFVNQIANLTGFSPTGSVESLLSEGKIDPQRAMAKNEKDSIWNQNLLNFVTGLNIQNTERPSYWNIAKGENQAYNESQDPAVRTKKRLEAGKKTLFGNTLDSQYTGRLSQ